ncbi:hypothetical protein FRC17_002044 [Serendipita sp. 399]|nr:hypothetical protein FRC17_002044 [Serendipita sp. 399]
MSEDRCLQTAKPTAVALGIPIFVEPGIQEWYSNVRTGTGLHPRPVSAQELLPHFDMIDPKWTPTFLVTRRGESVPDLYRRGEEFLQAFIARIDQAGYGGGHERVLLVSHAATVICLAQALLGDEEVGKTLRVGCCTLSTFDRKGSDKDALIGKGIWEARGELARGDFMRNGIERDWGMVDIELKDGVVIDDDGVPGTEQEHGAAIFKPSRSTISRSVLISTPRASAWMNHYQQVSWTPSLPTTMSLHDKHHLRRHQAEPRDDQSLTSSSMLPVLATSPYTVTERRKLGKYLSTAPMPAMFDAIVDKPLGTIEKGDPLGWDVLQVCSIGGAMHKPVNLEKPPTLQASMIQSPSERNALEVLSLAFVVRMPTPNIHPRGLACQHTIMLGTGISTVAIARQRADLKVSS